MATETVEAPRRGWVTPADVLRAMRALAGVVRDPDRTDLVGEFIGSLSAPSGVRLFHRLMNDPDARAVLEKGRDLKSTLGDRQALAAMPEGSLGRAYFDWTSDRDFDAEGIADAISKQVPRNLGGPFPTMAARVVDMHDLWHVLNGWDSDIHGELHLLGYSYAQLGGYAWLFLGQLTVLFLASGGRSDSAGYLRHAIARGRKARTLAGVDWEAMLPLPLDEVRRRLDVEDPLPYDKLGADAVERLRATSPILRLLDTLRLA